MIRVMTRSFAPPTAKMSCRSAPDDRRGHRRSFRLALVIAIGLVAVPGFLRPVSGQDSARDLVTVDLELVLAIDASASVDWKEFWLQRDGLAAAFRHETVVGAIEAAGDHGIAVTLVQWSGTGRQSTVVGWTHIRDRRTSEAFSDRIALTGRALTGMTDIGGAIDFSSFRLAANRFRGRRQVIDVSGDGSGRPDVSRQARDRAVARGITINGLVIYSEDIDLAELADIELRAHYADNVIGGHGAFLMSADGFSDFAIAIRRKLVREILGPALSRPDHHVSPPEHRRAAAMTGTSRRPAE